MRLAGTANDYVAKGMAGGTVVVVPEVSDPDAIAHGAGNACLYGATGGRLFVAGGVGQRFAVRNSGATAVVEGASDHACEYMTGGVVALLGPIGRNVGAGMTGGVVYVWDPDHTARGRLADSAPAAHRLGSDDAATVRRLVEEHVSLTGSRRCAALLRAWDEQVGSFWVVRPTTRAQRSSPADAAAVAVP
jgi:glutamate synthase domain-containing protein 3